MRMKKTMEQHSVNGVSMANGTVSFRSVTLNVYSFAIDGIIIDAGASALKKGFLPFWKQQPIDALYCTHLHEDHTGCATWFEQHLHVPIYLHESSLAAAKKTGDYPLYRKLFWGKRKPFHPAAIPATFQTRHSNWVSIFTPGHATDHVAFLNKSTGQLFTGDLYVQTKTKLIMDGESVPQIIASLHKLLQYDFEDVFCSHAGYLKQGRKKLLLKRDYLEALSNQVHDLYKSGLPIKEIQKRLFPRTYPITRFSKGEWDSAHLIKSALEYTVGNQ
ncbi:MBL fold metallo-hydrolase [Shouchella clausii]|uniref:MBL fold metallo-hydrolase n=1 Tax=Shouchella clausii TaxID=79880 RepID=UPI000BA77B79|nr:MBL fold metallo-hydrolase [Shouchella clausii]PAF13587.1 MBL fold metallo-hydrolase [Shouchella clausii]